MATVKPASVIDEAYPAQKAREEFLQTSVLTANWDMIYLWLVGQYAADPTMPKALQIAESFLVQGKSPLEINISEKKIIPKNASLKIAIETFAKMDETAKKSKTEPQKPPFNTFSDIKDSETMEGLQELQMAGFKPGAGLKKQKPVLATKAELQLANFAKWKPQCLKLKTAGFAVDFLNF